MNKRNARTHGLARERTGIIKTLRELMHPPEPKKRPIGFVELKEKK